jgi:hypothetical protein
MQMYHFNKMIPNRIFFIKLFGYSDLKYIFAVRKGGAIAHPDSYREVEQWAATLKVTNQNNIKVSKCNR